MRKPIPMKTTTYEWGLEVVHVLSEDVMETHHADTIQDAVDFLDVVPSGCRGRLVLIRDVGRGPDANHLDLVDRQWAYTRDGMLPSWFDGGTGVPNRFHRELASFVASYGTPPEFETE